MPAIIIGAVLIIICCLLGSLLVILKLAGLLAWSWWFVLSPVMAGVAIAIAVLVAFVIPMLLALAEFRRERHAEFEKRMAETRAIIAKGARRSDSRFEL